MNKNIIKIGRETFLKSENSLLNLRNVTTIIECEKTKSFNIYCYTQLFPYELKPKDKEEYHNIKKIFGIESL